MVRVTSNAKALHSLPNDPSSDDKSSAAPPGPRSVIKNSPARSASWAALRTIFTPGQRNDEPTARVPRLNTTINDDDPKAIISPRKHRWRRVNNNNLASDPRDARTP